MKKNGFRTKITNKIASEKSLNEVSISIPSNHRKDYGLDWAEASWTRWIYVIFWSWLNPILNIGSKRQLTDDDLFNLSSKDECSHLLNRIENVWEINQNQSKYLGHTKSSDSGTFFAYRKLKKNFFSYKKIERLLLYLFMLFDHYSSNIIVIKF
jgi:hypothetical protein